MLLIIIAGMSCRVVIAILLLRSDDFDKLFFAATVILRARCHVAATLMPFTLASVVDVVYAADATINRNRQRYESHQHHTGVTYGTRRSAVTRLRYADAIMIIMRCQAAA